MEETVAGGFAIMTLIVIFIWLIMFAAIICLGAFWVWMLVDCLQNTPDEDNQKLTWALVVVFANWIGALVYFFVQRPKNRQLQGGSDPNGT